MPIMKRVPRWMPPPPPSCAATPAPAPSPSPRGDNTRYMPGRLAHPTESPPPPPPSEPTTVVPHASEHLTLVVPTLHRYDLLIRMLASAEEGTRRPDAYHVIDNGGMLLSQWKSSNLTFPLHTRITVPKMNMGVGGSWNFGIEEALNWVLIVNDDVVLAGGAVERMLDVITNPAVVGQFPIVTSSQPDGTGLECWSMFMLGKRTIDEIGQFDDRFWPAYYEDTDYSRRLMLRGHRVRVVPDTIVEHHCASTLRSLDDARQRNLLAAIERCKQSYRDKWGGLPGQETLTAPRPVAQAEAEQLAAMRQMDSFP